MNSFLICNGPTCYLQQFEIPMTSNISYYVESGGMAAIIDPFRDISLYTNISKERSSKISHVLLTRIASDYIQGHRELSQLPDAQVVVGLSKNHQFDARIANDEEEISLGFTNIRVILTPGISHESCCYVLETKNDPDSTQKYLFSGDTVLLGDNCCPDATVFQSQEETQEQSAKLYESIHSKLMTLDESVIILPSHGFGFRMAQSVTKGNQDTLKNQKLSNPGMSQVEQTQFIKDIQKKAAQIPYSYEHILKTNLSKFYDDQSRSSLKGFQNLLSPDGVLELQQKGIVIIDTRHPQTFQSSFIEGSINISLTTKLELWMGILYEPFRQSFVVIAEDSAQYEEILYRFQRVGYEQFVVGILGGGFNTYEQSGFDISKIEQIDALTFKEKEYPFRPQTVDVRDEKEFKSGYLEFSHNIPISRIPSTLVNIDSIYDRSKPIYVYCNGGGRAAIGCSLLRANGFKRVFNVIGGMNKLKDANIPILQ